MSRPQPPGHARFEAGQRGIPEGEGRPPDPFVAVIFGASGDLTRRELIPALFELYCKKLLPDRFAIIGVARTDWSSEEFREELRHVAREECEPHMTSWERFTPHLRYVRADVTAPPEDDYAELSGVIEDVVEELDIPPNVFFHLAVPPRFFDVIAGRLRASGLAASERGWRRIVIEKPFGEDLQSARELDRRLLAAFEEDRIYRIDHFLGKETVQNMLVFRFANPSFEPIWNRSYIDHVQITVAEEIGIEDRAGFYESTGVVRDMVQNHLLQLLCMVGIEPPVNFDSSSLRDETVKVLEAVNFQPVNVRDGIVRGQYGAGEVNGRRVPAYREEENVARDSTTPTFAAVKLTVDNWRWADVPFYLRTGKRLPRKLTEVAIHFKPTPHVMFPVQRGQPGHQSVLVFRLQPQEGIIQRLLAKQPGPDLEVRPVRMNFLYADAFGVEEPPRAYAWLLLDVVRGNQTLFARSDWVRQAWSIVDPIVERWEANPPEDFPNYAAGTWGPPEARALLENEGREWQEI